jgi:hypothetical protein
MMQVVATSSPTGLNEPIALAENHRLFSKSRAQRQIPIAGLGSVQGNDFLFAKMLEKQKLQLRMQRK